MPESFNTRIADALLHAHIRSLRAGATVALEIRTILATLGIDLVTLLQAVDPAEPARQTTRRQRVEQVMERVRPRLLAAYRDLNMTATALIVERVIEDIEQVAQAVNSTAGLPLVQMDIDRSVVREQVATTLFPSPAIPTAASATLPEWWERQMRTMGQQVRDTLRIGVQQEETLSQLVARLRGTKAHNYQDGLVALSQRNAEAVALTAMSAGIHRGREALWEKNTAVIKGLITVATLDGRTSHICIARAGLMYSLPDYQPMGGHKVPYLGGPPWHWKCRSTMNPVFHSYTDLLGAKGARFDTVLSNLPQGTRSSLDGQVPAETTFSSWLEKQPERIQLRLLGRERLQLWKANKITLPQLISQVTGRPLRVEELVS